MSKKKTQGIFDDDQDDTITVSGKDCQNSLSRFFKCCKKILDGKEFGP